MTEHRMIMMVEVKHGPVRVSMSAPGKVNMKDDADNSFKFTFPDWLYDAICKGFKEGATITFQLDCVDKISEEKVKEIVKLNNHQV